MARDIGARAAPAYPDLAGKVVFVTGSSRGIGAEIARLFAEQDAKVAVHGRELHPARSAGGNR
jgi:NAD(P)-dependent dehydrogenase (short-subunit alcohol dehydrogenase family)